jgi:hypothetical protein
MLALLAFALHALFTLALLALVWLALLCLPCCLIPIFLPPATLLGLTLLALVLRPAATILSSGTVLHLSAAAGGQFRRHARFLLCAVTWFHLFAWNQTAKHLRELHTAAMRIFFTINVAIFYDQCRYPPPRNHQADNRRCATPPDGSKARGRNRAARRTLFACQYSWTFLCRPVPRATPSCPKSRPSATTAIYGS